MPHSERSGGGGLRTGEAAEAAGLTVRALHYYDQIGLAAPSGRSPAGHRLYQPRDVERLRAISALRPLGLPLNELRLILDGAGARPLLEAHLTDLGAQIRHMDRTRRWLADLLSGPIEDDAEAAELLRRSTKGATMTHSLVHQPITVLVYADLESVHRHLVDVFQLGPGHVDRDDDHRVTHAELDVGRGVLWLHAESERFALRSPTALPGTTSSTAVLVRDVDAHFAHARGRGAVIEYEPVDQPYGYREYSARDPEGGLWSFMAAL